MYRKPLVAASKKYEYTVNVRFTQGCICFVLSLVKKPLNEHIIYLQFFIFYWENLLKPIKLITQSCLFVASEFFFILTHIFRLRKNASVTIFFRWLAYKSFHSRFSVLINYTIWSLNIFSSSSCFPRFSLSLLTNKFVKNSYF